MSEKTVILFPGQGSQSALMGKELAEKNSDAMDLWKKAEKYSNLPLREIYWESNDDTLMAQTNNLQPALTVVNLSLWLENHSKMDALAFAGHSLGEYSSLAAAKVLSIDEVLQLVALRGKLMAEADPNHEGTMYVILRIGQEELEPLVETASEKLGRTVRIANYNTPKQFVISGYRDAIDEVVENLTPKAKAIPLAVSGAFHSPLMSEVNEIFTKELERYTWNAPIAPIYANVSGDVVVESKKMLTSMKKQMVSSVRWAQSMNKIFNAGMTSFTEVGPKGVLIRMLPHILPSSEITSVHYE